MKILEAFSNLDTIWKIILVVAAILIILFLIIAIFVSFKDIISFFTSKND
jgi:hypothetical protein